MSKPKTTTRKPRARNGSHRRKPMNVDAVIEMAAFRNHMRAMAAERQAFNRRNAPWRRIAAKLVALAIVGSITTVLVAHAMAYNAGPVLVAHSIH